MNTSHLKARRKSPVAGKNNQLRIIGGQWRGRKLAFPSLEGLRPTPDRVRETVFNWLSPAVPGSRCLDLFTGSGALGLEALSRGAAHADLVDSAAAVCTQLRSHLQTLDTHQAEIWQSTADQWLEQYPTRQLAHYDIIFLDPPFHRNLTANCIALIDRHQLLAAQGWVYLELASDEALPAIPEHWLLHREKTAGQVCYRLFRTDNQGEQSPASQV